MSVFTEDDATFIGFVVEGILWGLYIPIFAVSLGSMVWNKRSVNWFTVIAIVILFAGCTVHFSLNFSRIYDQLLLHPDPNVPLSQQTFISLASNIAFSITDFTAQTVLIYRCWKIYNKNLYIVLFPILLSLASVGTGLTGVIMLIMLANTRIELVPIVPLQLGISSFTISLGVNVLVTALIISRIYVATQRSQQSTGPGKSGMNTAIEAFIESGALFMLVQMIFVILFSTKNNGDLVGVAVAAQIYGIAPTLLIARVALDKIVRKGRETPQFSRVVISSPTGSQVSSASYKAGKDWVDQKEGDMV